MTTVVKGLSPDELKKIEEAKAQKQAIEAALSSVQFLNAEQRCYVVDLRYPVTYQGNVINKVTIRRPTMREWRAYVRQTEEMRQLQGEDYVDLVNQPWVSIPAVVLESLDVSDAIRVEAAQEGFFGRPNAETPDQTEAPATEHPESTSETGSALPSQ